MSKIKKSFFISILLSLGFCLSAANDLSDLRGLNLTNAKIPIYNRGGKPQMMIFVNRAERQGRVISGTGTVLDFLRPNVSVDDIGDAWKIKPYPLKAPFKTVFDFWLPRLKYSEAVVVTHKADIDQESHKASGSSAIYLRSPMLDLNGIGFETDFKRREIRVNSEIEVLIRQASHDPRKFDPQKAKAYQYITATGDSLLIELEERRIMLIGSVVIKESQATINCDRLTIVLNRDSKRGQQKKKEKGFNTSSGISGVSKLLADGNVIVTDSNKKSGRVYADHLVYDMPNSLITLTNDEYGTILTKEEIRSQAALLNKKTPDQIPGYVIIDSEQMRSYGKNVVINLKKADKNALPAAGLMTGGLTGSNAKAQAGALKNIVYPNGVLLCGKQQENAKENPFVISADYGEFIPEKNAVFLKEQVSATDGNTLLTCDTAELKLKEEKTKKASGAESGIEAILCRRNVQVLHKDASGKSGVLTSDKADFLPNSNRIVFYDNVQGKHENSTLACQQLELYLANRKNAAAPAPRPKTGLQSAASGSKTLEKAVASGSVVMTDPNAVLKTGLLTMYFRELSSGEKPAASMLQAGGVRLAKVECDNGINIVSNNKVNAEAGREFFGKTGSKGTKTVQAMRSVTDLSTNVSTFSGNVSIFDDLSKLQCDTMHLYGAAAKPVPAGKKAAPQKTVEDPDADPYELNSTENHAPSRIALTGDMELDKVECLDNVRLSRKVEGKWLTAGAGRADYKVSSQKIILTGSEPERAWIAAAGQKQTSDQLVYHLKDEKFESRGNTVTTLK